MISNQPAVFGGHRYCDNENVMFLVIEEQDSLYLLKGCICYIFVSLLFKSKGEHLGNKEKCFLFHPKSSFRSRQNQILEFKIFKFLDVIKCLSIK